MWGGVLSLSTGAARRFGRSAVSPGGGPGRRFTTDGSQRMVHSRWFKPKSLACPGHRGVDAGSPTCVDPVKEPFSRGCPGLQRRLGHPVRTGRPGTGRWRRKGDRFSRGRGSTGPPGCARSRAGRSRRQPRVLVVGALGLVPAVGKVPAGGGGARVVRSSVAAGPRALGPVTAAGTSTAGGRGFGGVAGRGSTVSTSCGAARTAVRALAGDPRTLPPPWARRTGWAAGLSWQVDDEGQRPPHHGAAPSGPTTGPGPARIRL